MRRWKVEITGNKALFFAPREQLLSRIPESRLNHKEEDMKAFIYELTGVFPSRIKAFKFIEHDIDTFIDMELYE
jgi:hypothetical protein